MLGIIGCAGMIGAVVFVFSVIGSLAAAHGTVGERLMTSVMPAGMAFVAALLLASRDRMRQTASMRSVRKRLLARQDVNDAEFSKRFPNADPVLVAQTRRAVAAFFNVPVEKIHPSDDLREDLGFDALEPGFPSFVVCQVLAVRNVQPTTFSFGTGGLVDLGDLVNEIQRVLDRVSSAARDDHGL